MGSYELALNNGKLFFNNSFIDAHIAVLDGRIAEIKKVEIHDAEQIIDCKGKLILPGIIDAHVHFRVPGNEKKEDWVSGSKAALHGGVTTVLDMPNNNPAIVTADLLEEKRKLVEKDSLINYGFHFGVSNGNSRELKNARNIASFKLYMGSTTGNLLVNDDSALEKCFEIASLKSKMIVVHAEDEKIILQNAKKFQNESTTKVHNKIRTVEAELEAIKKAISYAKQFKTRLHICHVSSKEALSLIQDAKKAGLHISCEVTPTYLFFDERDVEKKGSLLKVNPSIKTEKDRKALWFGLNTSQFDIIATDHAPHLLEEKQQDYWKAPSGIPGIETSLSLMLDASEKRLIQLEKAIKLMTEMPAALFKIKNKGKIEKGYDADLTIVDLKKEFVVKNEDLFSKSAWTPFEGIKLKGKVDKTLVKGSLLFDNDDIIINKNKEAKANLEVGYYG